MLESKVDLSEQLERMEAFYDLQHDPFGALVDSLVFSGVAGRYETAETIRHLLAYSDQDGLIYGPKGSGKRLVAQQVLKTLDNFWRVAWIDGSELSDLSYFLQEVVGQFGLGLRLDADLDVLLDRVIDVVKERTQAGESFLLVLQYADQVSPETLEKIEFLRSCTPVELRVRQLWLVEDEQFLLNVDNEVSWYQQSLLPLSDDDASIYLRDRLAAAGSVSQIPISIKDVSRLNQLAEGLPSALNDLARDYLISTTYRTAAKKQAFPFTHAIAGIAALSFVVIAFMYNQSENAKISGTISIPIESGPLSAVEQKLADAVAKVEAKQVVSADNTETGVLVENKNDQTTLQASADSGNPVSTPISIADSTEQKVDLNSETKAVEVNPIVDKSILLPNTIETAAETRLLDMADDNSFTLQLIGVHEKGKLDQIIDQFKDPNLVDVVTSTYKGKPWFILIYGTFDSKAAAKASVVSLPEQFKNVEPWIREISAVRAVALAE